MGQLKPDARSIAVYRLSDFSGDLPSDMASSDIASYRFTLNLLEDESGFPSGTNLIDAQDPAVRRMIGASGVVYKLGQDVIEMVHQRQKGMPMGYIAPGVLEIKVYYAGRPVANFPAIIRNSDTAGPMSRFYLICGAAACCPQ